MFSNLGCRPPEHFGCFEHSVPVLFKVSPRECRLDIRPKVGFHLFLEPSAKGTRISSRSAYQCTRRSQFSDSDDVESRKAYTWQRIARPGIGTWLRKLCSTRSGEQAPRIPLQLAVGSGAIESAHRFIGHVRLKRSGAWWYKENSNAILALRCALYNGTLDRVFQQYRENPEQSPTVTIS